MSPFITAGLSLALASLTEVAQAEEVSADAKAAARELAAQGIAEANAGNCDSAIPKLERAERLYHAPTILTSLGECQVRVGRLVEGTENLKRVTLERLEPGASPSFVEAKKKASALLDQTLPRIAKLTIVLKPEGLTQVEVRINGVPIKSELLGIARPTDPGEHTVSVTAEGYQTSQALVTLDPAEAETLTLELTPKPPVAEPVVQPAPEPEKPAPKSSEPSPAAQSSNQPLIGWIGVGVGAAALIGGGVTGALALDASNQLNCPNNVCSGDQVDKLDQANALALSSTILFGAGGALAVTGVILLLTSPSTHSERALIPSFHVANVKVEPQLHLTGASLIARY
jgi:hypothetical protein